MRVVCAIGLRDGPEVIERAVERVRAGLELVVLHVIDTGPRHDMDIFGGPLRHGPRGGPQRTAAINAAEDSSAEVAIREALAVAERLGVSATARIERGRPEQIVVAVAREVRAELVVIRAREHTEGRPFIGPPSVGHVARFVLDHAPCDVLLLRPGVA